MSLVKWALFGAAVIGAGVLGFYVGAQYAVGQVHSGVLDEIDKGLNAIGLNVNQDYGRAAHNTADATLGQILQ